MTNPEDEEETSMARKDKLFFEAITAKMQKMIDEGFAAYEERNRTRTDTRQTQEQDGRVHDTATDQYYQRRSDASQGSQRRSRHSRTQDELLRDNLKGLKISIPPFHGKTDPDAYLEWEKKIELVFKVQHYTEINRVRVAAAAFCDYALSWWDQLVKSRRRNGEHPVESWTEMKAIMRKRYIPSHYYRELLRSDKPRHQKEYISTLVSQPKQKSDVPKAPEKKNVLSQDTLCKQQAKPAQASVQTEAKISSAPNEQATPSKEAEPPAIKLTKDQEQTQDSMQLTFLKSLQPEQHLNANMSNIEQSKCLNSFSIIKTDMLAHDAGKTNLSSKHSESEQHNVSNHLEQNSTKNFTVQNDNLHNKEIATKPPNYVMNTGEIKRTLFSKPSLPKFVFKEALPSLTNPEPVLPSKFISFLQEFEDNNPGGLPQVYGLVHQCVVEPGSPTETVLYIIQNKQGKQHVVNQRYALLPKPELNSLDFEHVKELYNSCSDFKNMFLTCEKYAYEQHKSFLYKQFESLAFRCSMRSSVIDNFPRMMHCISNHRTVEASPVLNSIITVFGNVYILVYNNTFDDQTEPLRFKRKMFVESEKNTYCTDNCLFRVFVTSAQGMQAENMKDHGSRTWWSYFWFKIIDAQVIYEPWECYWTEQYLKEANQRRCNEIFDPGDWFRIRKKSGRFPVQTKLWLFHVWLKKIVFKADLVPIKYLRKEQHANKRQCQLIFEPDGIFWIQIKRGRFLAHKKINAYKTCSQGKYTVNSSFNVSDLSPFIADEADLRTNPFQEGGDDMSMAKDTELEPEHVPELEPEDALAIPSEPMTRARTRKLKETIYSRLTHSENRFGERYAYQTSLVLIQAA
ncbi:hypothetical protein V5N11_004059 [Cardamine amara subsp. amara]|uniref:Retrotransposon gag domain-containing protein n=1 Tax=Cardamine amara subsp. amara TaxID=228776 RepID=A0ABD1AQF2_CARAN